VARRNSREALCVFSLPRPEQINDNPKNYSAEIQHPAEDHPILCLSPTAWSLRQGHPNLARHGGLRLCRFVCGPIGLGSAADARSAVIRSRRRSTGLCVPKNLNPNVMVMKSAEDRI
jgi:hypothetical protein